MKKLYTFKNGPVFLAHPVHFCLEMTSSSVFRRTFEKFNTYQSTNY